MQFIIGMVGVCISAYVMSYVTNAFISLLIDALQELMKVMF